MNQLFLYTEGRSEKLDANKGLLLRGDIGTGKSTIMQILNRYSYFTRGKAKGTELNVMQYIFQCRYELRHEAITHVTTNLTIKEIQAIYGAYIADRINEMFNVLDLNGASRR